MRALRSAETGLPECREQEGLLSVCGRSQTAEREKTGTVKGAVHAPRAFLEFMADPASERHIPELSSGKRLVLFCASGGRSALAAKTLKDMGGEKVAHVAGGFGALEKAGASTEHQ